MTCNKQKKENYHYYVMFVSFENDIFWINPHQQFVFTIKRILNDSVSLQNMYIQILTYRSL